MSILTSYFYWSINLLPCSRVSCLAQRIFSLHKPNYLQSDGDPLQQFYLRKLWANTVLAPEEVCPFHGKIIAQHFSAHIFNNWFCRRKFCTVFLFYCSHFWRSRRMFMCLCSYDILPLMFYSVLDYKQTDAESGPASTTSYNRMKRTKPVHDGLLIAEHTETARLTTTTTCSCVWVK